VSSHSAGVKSPTTFHVFLSLGGPQLTLAPPSSFFYWIITPILYVRCSCFFLCSCFLTISWQNTNVWYSAHLPSITPTEHTTSLESSTTTRRSTSRLTRLTVLCSCLPPLPSHTDSHLRRSLPHSPTPSSITANRSGFRLVTRSQSNLISMPVS